MKKYLISIISCVLVGLLMGKIIFEQYKSNDTLAVSTTSISEEVYFFQTGVYSSLDNMKKAMSNINSYAYILEDNKYYVFLAITKNEENKEKLKNYFNSLSYNIYIKKITIDNEAFLNTLNEYDKLLKDASSNSDIKKINDAVLEKYEELVNNG